MNCEVCTELMADFLLDELPESQAVLLHEHLNLCLGCARTYKELKGTGVALEAVPEMRPAQPTPEFEKKVKVLAASELADIVARLPVEQRIRLEARRAFRRSQSMARSAPPPPKFSWASPLLLIAGVVFVAVGALFVISWRDPAAISKTPLGKLILSNGKADQRHAQQLTPALAGREILPDDAFLTADNGCARFELVDGSDLFVGPSTQISFSVGTGNTPVVIELEFGQIGIQRKSSGEDVSEFSEIRCGPFRILAEKNTHAYLRFDKASETSGTIDVFSGTVHVYKNSTERLALAVGGTRLTFKGLAELSSTLLLNQVQTQPPLVPTWRVDLVTESDLARWLKTPAKIVSRTVDGLEVSLVYGSSAAKSSTDAASPQIACEDWCKENNENLVRRADGSLTLIPGARLKHSIPFAAPLSMVVTHGADSAQESALAFGVLESPQGGVSVDVGREATLQARAAGRPTRSSSIQVRKTNKAEYLRLDLIRESGALTAVLSSASGKCQILSLSQYKDKDKVSGELWIQALGNGIVLESLQVTATIPNEWLRAKLSSP